MYGQEVIFMKCRELLEEYRALLDRDTVLHMEQNMSPAGYEKSISFIWGSFSLSVPQKIWIPISIEHSSFWSNVRKWMRSP